MTSLIVFCPLLLYVFYDVIMRLLTGTFAREASFDVIFGTCVNISTAIALAFVGDSWRLADHVFDYLLDCFQTFKV